MCNITKSDHSEDEFLQFLNDIQTAPEEWKHVPVPSEALSGIRKRLDSMRQGDELGIEQCKEQGNEEVDLIIITDELIDLAKTNGAMDRGTRLIGTWKSSQKKLIRLRGICIIRRI
ncbi:hypothetical protein VTP01DRAFT_6536 [Rhizomucor pusillus]|uniref:uncharacterized protein n=1 Tax=Rhizomucor pusillus TaxID=4840 RepID=UPI00374269A8